MLHSLPGLSQNFLTISSKFLCAKVVHNASILTAVGCCGLQLYNFGETVSIPFWSETWEPDSFLDKIEANLERGLHTLCLLGRKQRSESC